MPDGSELSFDKATMLGVLHPMSARMKAMRNLIAERALLLGRHLTAEGKIANLEAGLDLPRGYIAAKLKP